MQKKPFTLLMLVAISAASRAATVDFSSMGPEWVWTLALSLYAVTAVLFSLALCKSAAASDACEERARQ